jgi:hypothetical protein
MIIDTLTDWILTYFPEISISNEITQSSNLIPNYVENQELIVYAHRWKYGTSIAENTLLNDSAFCQTSNNTICTTCTNRYFGYVYCSNGDFNCNGQSNSCQNCRQLECNFSSPPYDTLSVAVPPPIRTLVSVDHHSTHPVETVVQVVSYEKKGKNKKHKVIKYVKKIINKVVKWTTLEWVTTPNPSPTKKTAYGTIKANVQMSFQDRSEEENIFAVAFKIKNCSWTFDRFLQ